MLAIIHQSVRLRFWLLVQGLKKNSCFAPDRSVRPTSVDESGWCCNETQTDLANALMHRSQRLCYPSWTYSKIPQSPQDNPPSLWPQGVYSKSHSVSSGQLCRMSPSMSQKGPRSICSKTGDIEHMSSCIVATGVHCSPELAVSRSR